MLFGGRDVVDRPRGGSGPGLVVVIAGDENQGDEDPESQDLPGCSVV